MVSSTKFCVFRVSFRYYKFKSDLLYISMQKTHYVLPQLLFSRDNDVYNDYMIIELDHNPI